MVHIFGIILATLCSAERSFSALSRLKTYLRSTMGQQPVSNIALINIERAHWKGTCQLSSQLSSQQWHGPYHFYLRSIIFNNMFTSYVGRMTIVLAFRLFCKNLGNLGEFFGQMVYRPPGHKLPVRLWPFQRVFSKSDTVFISSPRSSLPNFVNQHTIVSNRCNFVWCANTSFGNDAFQRRI